MAVNLATKYASKLDQLFTAGSYTDRYVNKTTTLPVLKPSRFTP